MKKTIASVLRAGLTTVIGIPISSLAALPAPSGMSQYTARAPIAAYMMESEAAEVALARSAAPPAVADAADVMVLGIGGYRTVAKGTNGFVCMVWRSWSDDLADEQFFNPKVRAPICLNAVAVKTVLPDYFRRTAWILADMPRAEMQRRVSAATSKSDQQLPGPGAMSYMMSRQGYLADGIGHASPHIMFFVARKDHQDWGANLPESPIWAADSPSDPVALFFVTVPRWSDGTPAIAH